MLATQGFYSACFKPGFMDIGKKMVKFCGDKLASRKIEPRFVSCTNFCGANIFTKNDFKIPK